MAINLVKGQNIELGLKNAIVTLGWRENASGGADFDLDASAFMLGQDGQIPEERFFVFYNNLVSPEGAVSSSGDDLTGEDGETLTVDLEKVDPRVEEIIFTVTIHDAEGRRQNFGQVRDSFISIKDATTGEEILRFDLDEDYSTATAVEFGRLYRRRGAWKFQAIGDGVPGGLAGLVKKYARNF